MEKGYDVVIVGAGPNGLTAGAYLAKAGARVLLIERRHETGGALVTEEFRGFRFNLHAFHMLMIEVMPPYKDLDIEGFGCRYIKPEAQVSLLTKDGKALTLHSDVAKSCESIEKFSLQDAKRFKEVWAEISEITDEALIPATYTLPTPPLDHAIMYNESELGKKIISYSEKSPKEIIKDWGFGNDYLNALLQYLACMWGLDPNLSGVGYMVPLLINRMLNQAMIIGGSHRFSSCIQKVARAYGADILEATEVTDIIVEEGGVRGVKVAGGDVYEARAVITSTDPHTTFLELIDEDTMKGISSDVFEAAKAWEWESWSLFGLHLALKERPVYKASESDPAVEKSMVKIMGYESAEDVLGHISDLKKGKVGFGAHTSTSTDLDPMQAPADTFPGTAVARWETMAPFKPADGEWEDIKEDYADRVMEQWKVYAPNLGNRKPIHRYLYTPDYIEKKLVNMVNGSIKHGAYISTQMGYFRPNDSCSGYRTPVKGLYLAGASTYPGGMVLLGGGYNAAGIVADDLGLDRWWKEPEMVKRAREKKLVE
ncbi:MAG: NAD(P)/FAD-dependent oxidoreductase [Thermodesulfobacteriota bacterium]|nr:NAD(P)/FAD-dependent oxidoreductase [Thermodesulfobacteriota bacterium]